MSGAKQVQLSGCNRIKVPAMISKDKLSFRRLEMVAGQIRSRSINDEAVLEAFRRTPRERFIPPEHFEDAYADHPVSIGFGQTVSQPYIVALMVEELAVSKLHRVLDVGSGSGYQTAILAQLARQVYGVERIEQLAERSKNVLAGLKLENVTIQTGDGSLGLPDEGPFDRIICGAAAPSVPKPWLDQLRPGGRIVLPVGDKDSQKLIVVEKLVGEVRRREVCEVRFVELLGRFGWDSA